MYDEGVVDKSKSVLHRSVTVSEPSAEEVLAGDAQSPIVFAIDIGTSSVRAALYDARAHEITGTRSRIERGFVTTADGGAELDADEAIADVARVIDETLTRVPAGAVLRPEAVAVSCFWHSLVGINNKGQALTPVLGWADTRARDEVFELRRRLDERATHGRTGCRFHASYWPAKLRWLKNDRPEVCRNVTRWLSFGEFLALRLSGEANSTASVSMASGTGLLDCRRSVWDTELLAHLNISPDQLPTLADARSEGTFTLASEYGKRWPLLGECRWFPAVGDGASNNIGTGCVTREQIGLMVGTSGAMRVVYEGEAPIEIPPSLWCYRADRRRICMGGALSDGGGLHDWMNDTLMLDDDARATETALAAMEPDAHGLTVLPFWAGERSTGWNADARGAILGLTMHTKPLEILRASMEAVAYRIALIADALGAFAPGAEVCASGGALRASPVWAQMMADVMNRSVKILRAREASSRGVVLLVLESLGVIKSLNETTASFSHIYQPDTTRHARYREGLERQRKFYELLIGT